MKGLKKKEVQRERAQKILEKNPKERDRRLIPSSKSTEKVMEENGEYKERKLNQGEGGLEIPFCAFSQN